MDKKLFVIEGFDRAGKDTLLNDLEKIKNKKFYVYKSDLSGLPKYDKEQSDFISWLNRFIDTQIKQLNELFNTYDIIIMTRLIISDEVYSTLFNREHTTIKYLKNLREDVELYNYCLLFESYDEYLKRLNIINESIIQYNRDDFNKINDLYKDIIEKSEYKSYINYVKANDQTKDILSNFINIEL